MGLKFMSAYENYLVFRSCLHQIGSCVARPFSLEFQPREVDFCLEVVVRSYSQGGEHWAVGLLGLRAPPPGQPGAG